MRASLFLCNILIWYYGTFANKWIFLIIFISTTPTTICRVGKSINKRKKWDKIRCWRIALLPSSSRIFCVASCRQSSFALGPVCWHLSCNHGEHHPRTLHEHHKALGCLKEKLPKVDLIEEKLLNISLSITIHKPMLGVGEWLPLASYIVGFRFQTRRSRWDRFR